MAAQPMILLLEGVPDETAITLPLIGFFGNVRVDWGDGTITEDTVEHTYTNTQDTNYTIKITETIDAITGFGNEFDSWTGSQYLTTIQQWGDFPFLTDINKIGGADLISVPNVLPSTVTNIAFMFSDSSNFNDPNVITWDVSRVLNMGRVFQRAALFNQPIGGWNVGQATTMVQMFRDATAFNQDIGSWNVSKVTDMGNMFTNLSAMEPPVFNQDISNWNVENVLNLNGIFAGSSFNQNLGRWNISAASNDFIAMQNIFNQETIDTLNYSATLNGWADISGTLAPNDPDSFVVGGGNSIYESARAAYTTLTSDPINWYIRPSIDDEFDPLIVNPTPELEFQYNTPTTREYYQGIEINPYIPVFASLYSDVQFQISPVSPALPAGLVIDPTNGKISGTPTVAAVSKTYTIKATANAGAVIQSFDITLTVVNLVSYNPAAYSFLNNVQIEPIEPTVNPGTTINRYAITPAMTNGLTFNTTTGIITGTPTSVLNQTYTITATTSTGIVVNKSITITVNDIRYTTTAFTFLAGVSIRPINPTFDPVSLQGTTFEFQAPAPAGLTIVNSTGIINGTMTTDASSDIYNVVISLTTELTTYTKIVPLIFTVADINYTPESYTFLAGISIQPINPVLAPLSLTGATFEFQTTPTGLTIENTTGSITGTMNNNASSDTYNIVITFSNYTKTVPLTFTVADITYTPESYTFLAKATIVPIQPLLIPEGLTGATFAFQAPSPSGLTIGNTSGIITGAMPTAASSTTYNVVITLITNVASYTKPIIFTFTVSNITYNPSTYNFLAGIAIETIQPIIPTYSAEPDSITYTASNLPNGLVVDTITGFITGTPASESTGTNTALISVLNAGVVLNTNSLVISVLDVNYNRLAYTFTVSVPITTISPSSSYLTDASILTFAPPANLRVDASGNITGTPLVAAPETTYNLTLTVANTTYQKTIPFSFTVINFTQPLILQFGSIPTNFQISLPLIGITGNFLVDWGDGSPTTTNIYKYTYTNSGFANYTVKITILNGILLGFGSIDWAGSAFLTSIDEWGELPGISALNYIGGAMLTNVPTVLPTTITDLSYMFSNASKFNQPIGTWDVSRITTMAYMFNQASVFNQNLGDWRINNVSNMTHMFF